VVIRPNVKRAMSQAEGHPVRKGDDLRTGSCYKKKTRWAQHEKRTEVIKNSVFFLIKDKCLKI
jgi:hypothetical protein